MEFYINLPINLLLYFLMFAMFTLLFFTKTRFFDRIFKGYPELHGDWFINSAFMLLLFHNFIKNYDNSSSEFFLKVKLYTFVSMSIGIFCFMVISFLRRLRSLNVEEKIKALENAEIKSG